MSYLGQALSGLAQHSASGCVIVFVLIVFCIMHNGSMKQINNMYKTSLEEIKNSNHQALEEIRQTMQIIIANKGQK